jgi:XTP/dITP diphosphohydrolase
MTIEQSGKKTTVYSTAYTIGVSVHRAAVRTISKFIHRFRYIEENTAEAGKSLKDMTLDEMEQLWQQAKNR